MEFYDEMSQLESSVDGGEEEEEGEEPGGKYPASADFAIKYLHLNDLSAELGSAEGEGSSVEGKSGGGWEGTWVEGEGGRGTWIGKGYGWWRIHVCMCVCVCVCRFQHWCV